MFDDAVCGGEGGGDVVDLAVDHGLVYAAGSDVSKSAARISAKLNLALVEAEREAARKAGQVRESGESRVAGGESAWLRRAVAFNKNVGWYTRAPMSLVNFILLDAVVLVSCGLLPRASVGAVLAVYYIGVAMIGGVMSVMLHRFFSHGAFTASRRATFVLAVISCLALQRGPVWWASKHIRHHANCDTDEDPHSPVKDGAFYCIFFSSFDCDVDWKYVPKRLMYPELIVLDTLHFVPPMLLLALNYAITRDMYYTMYYGALPMTWCVLMTNVFNWRFHDDNDSMMHPDKHGECKAVDRRTELMANLVGENLHMQHHVHPRQAQRHSADLPYWLVIRPLLALNVISQPNYDGLLGNKEVHFDGREINLLGALRMSLIEIVVIGATAFFIARMFGLISM